MLTTTQNCTSRFSASYVRRRRVTARPLSADLHYLQRRVCCCGRVLGQTGGLTDRETDGRTPFRYIDPAAHTSRPITRTVSITCGNLDDGRDVA